MDTETGGVACLPASLLLFFSDVSTVPSADDCAQGPVNVTAVDWTADRSDDDGVKSTLRRVAVGVVLATFAAFTVAGNGLVMAAVAREPCLRSNVTNRFVFYSTRA